MVNFIFPVVLIVFCSSNATISSKMLKHFYTILQCLEEHGSQFMLHIFTNDFKTCLHLDLHTEIYVYIRKSQSNLRYQV